MLKKYVLLVNEALEVQDTVWLCDCTLVHTRYCQIANKDWLIEQLIVALKCMQETGSATMETTFKQLVLKIPIWEDRAHWKGSL